MADPIAVRVEALTKTYGSRRVIDHLTFAVPAGSVCGFIGPNGAGKTTTLRVLLGLVRPTSGAAWLFGHPVEQPQRYVARVGALIEAPAFYPPLSGRKNLEVLARLAGLGRSRIDRVLEQVELTGRDGDPYRSYSLGMKQRLGIAAALLREPDLLILDEPMNGLDPAGMRDIRTQLRLLADDGITVLVSSHLLDEIQQICDHLVVIRAGSLIFDGSVSGLLAARQPKLIAQPEATADLTRLAALCMRAHHDATIVDSSLQIDAPTSWAAELNRRAMAAGITLVRLAETNARLEDVFIELTGTDQ